MIPTLDIEIFSSHVGNAPSPTENSDLNTSSSERYRFKETTADFMNNERWRQVDIELTENYKRSMQHQEEIDAAYSQCCTICPFPMLVAIGSFSSSGDFLSNVV